jgi:hypothetical protein
MSTEAVPAVLTANARKLGADRIGTPAAGVARPHNRKYEAAGAGGPIPNWASKTMRQGAACFFSALARIFFIRYRVPGVGICEVPTG